jgi:hypothetical protein
VKKDSPLPEQIEPVPNKGITIEFPFTTASSFEFAVKEAEKLPNFKKFGDGKNSLYRVTVDQSDLNETLDFIEQLKGWRKRTVYVDGEKVTWDSVFSFFWCCQKKKSSYKPDLYCFGLENEWDFNLWGCARAGMPFSEQAQWGTYGKWLNKDGDWEFDKKQIKHELEKNLYQYRFCPSLNLNFVQDVIDAIPNVVNPAKNKNWKFIESYDSESTNGLTLIIKQYGYERKVVMKGVCPTGKGFIQEIQKRMKLKIPNGL